MTESEKKFNDLAESAFDKIKSDYKSKFKSGNPLTDMIHNNKVHGEMLTETADKIAEVANSIYDDSDREIALKLCQDKTREFLPEMKKLRGF